MTGRQTASTLLTNWAACRQKLRHRSSWQPRLSQSQTWQPVTCQQRPLRRRLSACLAETFTCLVRFRIRGFFVTARFYFSFLIALYFYFIKKKVIYKSMILNVHLKSYLFLVFIKLQVFNQLKRFVLRKKLINLYFLAMQ